MKVFYLFLMLLIGANHYESTSAQEIRSSSSNEIGTSSTSTFVNKINDSVNAITSTAYDVLNYLDLNQRNLRGGFRKRLRKRGNRTRVLLEHIYNATGGSGTWTANEGWLDEHVNECDWEGVVCDDNNFTVTELHLSNAGLTGSIPIAFIHKLFKLNTLDLSSNDLVGSIPDKLARMLSLRHFNVSGNQLTGSIPSRLGFLFNLETLDLSDNLFSNQAADPIIPTNLGFLINLQTLKLGQNDFSGTMPNQMCLLKGAWALDNITSNDAAIRAGITARSGICDLVETIAGNSTGVGLSILTTVCNTLVTVLGIEPSLETLSADCNIDCPCCSNGMTPCCILDTGVESCNDDAADLIDMIFGS